MSLQVSNNWLTRIVPLSIFLTAVMTSCGPGAKNPLIKTTNQPVTISSALSRCNSEPSQAIQELEAFAKYHSQGLVWAERFAITDTRTKVQKISRRDLEAAAKRLLNGRLKNQNSARFEAAVSLRSELLDLRSTLNQVQRLKFLECHIDDYWEIGKIPYDAYQDSLAGNESVETTAQLCAPIKGLARCTLEARLASKQGILEQVHESYRAQFHQKFFAPRFQISSKNNALSCTKNADSFVLNIPVKLSTVDYQLMSAAMTKWWSAKEKFRINLVPSSSQEAIVLNRLPQGPSFVTMDERSRINLAPGHDIPTVVAHEFGHVLGFPDCYFESWSRSDNAFTYLEFDQSRSNLMCSIDSRATIPEDYFKQLKETYCED